MKLQTVLFFHLEIFFCFLFLRKKVKSNLFKVEKERNLLSVFTSVSALCIIKKLPTMLYTLLNLLLAIGSFCKNLSHTNTLSASVMR